MKVDDPSDIANYCAGLLWLTNQCGTQIVIITMFQIYNWRIQ